MFVVIFFLMSFSLINLFVLVFYSGWFLMVEVKSSFDLNNGGVDLNMFLKVVCEMGFILVLKVIIFFLSVNMWN